MAPPKRPWFRFYVEAVHDRKLRRQKPETRWLFVACLAAARQSCEPGWLLVSADDPMGWDDLVDFAAMPLKQVEVGMDALQDAGVVGFDLTRHAWFIPSWNDRQYESDDVTKRTQRHRRNGDGTSDATTMERSKNGDTWSDGTPPETETETETESSSSLSGEPLPLPAEEEDLFHDACLVLAERALAAQPPGSVRIPDRWLAKAVDERKERHRRRLAESHPSSPQSLADWLEPAASHPLDEAQRAQRAVMVDCSEPILPPPVGSVEERRAANEARRAALSSGEDVA